MGFASASIEIADLSECLDVSHERTSTLVFTGINQHRPIVSRSPGSARQGRLTGFDDIENKLTPAGEDFRRSPEKAFNETVRML
jgi:hypothetical protein